MIATPEAAPRSTESGGAGEEPFEGDGAIAEQRELANSGRQEAVAGLLESTDDPVRLDKRREMVSAVEKSTQAQIERDRLRDEEDLNSKGRYFLDERNAEGFRRVVDGFQKGESMREMLAEAVQRDDREQVKDVRMFNEALHIAATRDSESQERDWDALSPEQKVWTRFSEAGAVLSDVADYEIQSKDGNYAASEDGQRAERALNTLAASVQDLRDMPESVPAALRERSVTGKDDAVAEQELSGQDGDGQAPEHVEPATHQEQSVEVEGGGTVVTLERDSNAKLFGQESPVQVEDLQAAQARLTELMREDTRDSAYKAAKLAWDLQRSKIRLGDSREQVGKFLQKHRAAMMRKEPRAVAQYLAYCKDIGVAGELTEAEGKYIMAGIHHRLQKDPKHEGLSALAMNANRLGVYGYTPELVRQGIQEEHEALRAAGDIDRVVRSEAHAKFAGVRLKIQDDGSLGSAINQRFREHKAAGRWDKFAQLRRNYNIARPLHRPTNEEERNMVSHTASMRSEEAGGAEAFASYMGDVAELSAQGERRQREVPVSSSREGRDSYERAQMSEEEYQEMYGSDAAAQGPVVASVVEEPRDAAAADVPPVRGETIGGVRSESASARQPERVRPESAARERRVDAEQYPRRAAFERAAQAHYQGLDAQAQQGDMRVDVLKMNEVELQGRERVLEQRREARLNSTDEASQIVDRLRRGAKFGEVLDEGYMRAVLDKHRAAGPQREARRQRYLEIMDNEMGFAQDIDDKSVLNKMTTHWTERLYARFNCAKGVGGKLKALWPGGRARQESWQNVVAARQDAVRSMRAAAQDPEVDPRMQAVFDQMADEYELLNVRDTNELRRRGETPADKGVVSERRAQPIQQEQPESPHRQFEEYEREVKKAYKKKYKKKYKRKYREKFEQGSRRGRRRRRRPAA